MLGWHPRAYYILWCAYLNMVLLKIMQQKIICFPGVFPMIVQALRLRVIIDNGIHDLQLPHTLLV